MLPPVVGTSICTRFWGRFNECPGCRFWGVANINKPSAAMSRPASRKSSLSRFGIEMGADRFEAICKDCVSTWICSSCGQIKTWCFFHRRMISSTTQCSVAFVVQVWNRLYPWQNRRVSQLEELLPHQLQFKLSQWAELFSEQESTLSFDSGEPCSIVSEGHGSFIGFSSPFSRPVYG